MRQTLALCAWLRFTNFYYPLHIKGVLPTLLGVGLFFCAIIGYGTSHVTTTPLYSTWPPCESIKAGHTWYFIARDFMSEVMNRPCSLSENSVASYSMIIGGIWTAIIQDKRTLSSMYSFNLTQFCNSGKSYNVLHSCLLTSWKGEENYLKVNIL